MRFALPSFAFPAAAGPPSVTISAGVPADRVVSMPNSFATRIRMVTVATHRTQRVNHKTDRRIPPTPLHKSATPGESPHASQRTDPRIDKQE